MLDTPPTLTWTPELVEIRLVEAFETLRAVGGRPGPKSYGSNWPAIVKEVDDWQRDDDKHFRRQIEKDEIGRMDEALQWPFRYLDRDPKMADALNVWAFCKANHMRLDRFARHRADRATALALRVQAEHDEARQKQIDQAHAEADAWAVERMLEARGDPERIARIRANAELRKQRQVVAIKLQLVDPSNIMPDKAISASELTRQRYAASAFVAFWLNRDQIPGAPEAAQRAAEKAEAALQLAV